MKLMLNSPLGRFQGTSGLKNATRIASFTVFLQYEQTGDIETS